MPLLDPRLAKTIGTLQLLDDAIAYRLDRLNRPCPGCRPDARCAAHRHDEQLIVTYQGRYAAAFRDALAGMDTRDIALIMHPGDRIPATAAGLSLMVMTRLRELAAGPAGPVVIDLGCGPAVIELDGPAGLEHPLTRNDGPWPRRATPPAWPA